MPLQREIGMSVGLSAATENSLTTLLGQSNDPADESNRVGYSCNGVGLICGGLRESLVPIPNHYKCVISKRRGFARIALKTGASLVPVISFGESNIYELLFQETIQRFIDFPGILNGRGLLQYNFGLLPKRHPINTVIGAPIHLKKTLNPTKEELDTVHALFCTALKELFEKHKHKYHDDPDNVHMELV